jgi:hypothetical protein
VLSPLMMNHLHPHPRPSTLESHANDHERKIFHRDCSPQPRDLSTSTIRDHWEFKCHFHSKGECITLRNHFINLSLNIRHKTALKLEPLSPCRSPKLPSINPPRIPSLNHIHSNQRLHYSLLPHTRLLRSHRIPQHPITPPSLHMQVCRIVKCSPRPNHSTLHKVLGMFLGSQVRTDTCKTGSHRLHRSDLYVHCQVNSCLQGCSGIWFNRRKSCGISHWVYMDIPDYEGVFLLIRNTTLDTNIHNLSKTKIMVIDEICISRKYGSLGGVRNGVSISNGVFSFTTFFLLWH